MPAVLPFLHVPALIPKAVLQCLKGFEWSVHQRRAVATELVAIGIQIEQAFQQRLLVDSGLSAGSR